MSPRRMHPSAARRGPAPRRTPQGNASHGKPPHGKPPHGNAPHGRPPHGHATHGKPPPPPAAPGPVAQRPPRHGRPRDVGALVYGRQPVLELLRAGRRRVIRLYLQESELRGESLDALLSAARKAGVSPAPTDRRELERLTNGGHHQGVVAEAAPYPYADFETLVERTREQPGRLWLLLDHLEDPHNVGALLRSAEAAGVTGVVIPQDRAVEITDTVVRTSAGAAEHVAVCRVVNLVRAMQTLQASGVWLFGLEASPQAQSYAEADLAGPVGVVIGGEGQGLGRLVRETCDFRIRIPMAGRVASLNASVAGAIVLYEAVRRRTAAIKAPPVS